MARSLAEHLDPKEGPKRILALDGGGTRGIVSLAFLQRIEDVLALRYGRVGDFRLHEYFDLIGGTSVGALIAAQLALGKSVKEIRELFRVWAKEIFARNLTHPASLLSRFDSTVLRQKLDEAVGDRMISSEDLKTGLAIIMKRVNTGSPWIIMNNSRGQFWDQVRDGTGADENHKFLLADLLEASTSAPFHFTPKKFVVGSGDNGQPEKGLFVDGGVSPHNSPALQLLMTALIDGYRLNWKPGPDDLMIISIGTGTHRVKIERRYQNLISELFFANNALQSVITDSQIMNLKMLQWLSKSDDPWSINSEVGNLDSDLLTEFLGGTRGAFHFKRFDVGLEGEWLSKELGRDFSGARGRKLLLKMRQFTNPNYIALLEEIGTQAAFQKMKQIHFPKVFD